MKQKQIKPTAPEGHKMQEPKGGSRGGSRSRIPEGEDPCEKRPSHPHTTLRWGRRDNLEGSTGDKRMKKEQLASRAVCQGRSETRRAKEQPREAKTRLQRTAGHPVRGRKYGEEGEGATDQASPERRPSGGTTGAGTGKGRGTEGRRQNRAGVKRARVTTNGCGQRGSDAGGIGAAAGREGDREEGGEWESDDAGEGAKRKPEPAAPRRAGQR